VIEGASEKRGDDNGDALNSPSAHAHSLALPINPLPTAELLATTDVVSSNTLGPVKPVKRLHPNANDDRVRAFDEQGYEYQGPELERRKREILETMDLDDLTQKSAMSLTQENTPSAYDQFNIQQAIRDDYPSTATPDDGDVYEPRTQNHASLHSKQYASARTESTAHTYEENDSKYIQIDFEPSSVVAGADDEDDDVDGEASQDPPLPVPRFEQPQSYEPQTPAPPLNPFLRKGSVMKASQMFGATQPSSIGRRVSPTSSRPSPDVYNDFSSPPKRSRLHSSPLGPRKDVNDDTSPLQSSVRHILAASNFQSTDSPSATIQRTSGVRSFDAGPRIQRSGLVHEPRPYLSMKESQERRKVSQSDTDSDSDSSIDARPLKRLERDRRIRQELSNVGRMPTSSRPSSASAAEATSTGQRQNWQENGIAQREAAGRATGDLQIEGGSSRPGSASAVEIPSTGRRRSIQEEYIVQCEGRDARDTQEEHIRDTPQDDIVADSQSILNQEQEVPEACPSSNEPPAADALKENQPTSPSIVSQEEPLDVAVPNLASDTSHLERRTEESTEQKIVDASAATANAPEPSLPLQESSTNQNKLRTPLANKNQPFSDGPDTVPETSPPERTLMDQRSPPEERLRPMGEIASISFGPEGFDMANLPGFTPDVDFESVMRMGSSPRPLPRVTSRNAPPAQVSGAVVVDSKPTTAHDIANASMDPLPAKSPEQAANSVEEARNAELMIVSDEAQEEVASEQQDQHDDNETPADDAGNASITDGPHDSTENLPASPSAKRTGLRMKSELKGPSRALRRLDSTSRSNTPTLGVSRQVRKGNASASRSARRSSTALRAESVDPLPAEEGHAVSKCVPPASSSTVTTFTRSSKRKSAAANNESTPAHLPKRTSKRKSTPTVIDNFLTTTRSSKRQSMARDAKEDSEDPLALAIPNTSVSRSKPSGSLFAKMAFAVSYSKHEDEKNEVTRLIVDNGGQVLQDGFDNLFETSKFNESEAGLTLSAAAKPLGFAALIADEHSRKAKYMQALALGLPCISGQWILACVSKNTILAWPPYLLCAGQSSFLGNAMKSRVLSPYPAAEAALEGTLAAREKLLDGKSVLIVTPRGKAEKRKPYVFLTRALGPSRVGQVGDLSEARTRLGSEEWDLLYSDCSQETAAATVFGHAASNGASKKRKRGPAAVEDPAPSPKRIRVIDDETMIQSLILGQLMEA